MVCSQESFVLITCLENRNELTQGFPCREDLLSSAEAGIPQDWAEISETGKVYAVLSGGRREGQTAFAKAGGKSTCFMKCFMVKLELEPCYLARIMRCDGLNAESPVGTSEKLAGETEK